MSAAVLASRVLLGVGVAIICGSALGALAFRHSQNRLHYITPMTTIGAPMVGLALAIENSWGETTAQILLTVFLLAVTGPVLESATGRLIAQREGWIPRRSPR
ncbi:MAG TPA: monovalent cation/H(+) antiporter subunit G [Acidimicrobiales bacterium]|nr:monovalent cation/H(+) antiporter subunit G [Acidimicrobiales bacterium]